MTGVTAGIIWGSVIAAGIGAATTAVTSNQAKQAQKGAAGAQQRAQAAALTQAKDQQRQSEYAVNAANRQSPDVSGIMERAGAGAGAGTMLTGPSGVDPNALALGKNTLLGG